MYVCLCNALTEAHVRQAVHTGGARRPAEVFAACSCRAQCGTCVRALCDLTRREVMIAPLVRAASGSCPLTGTSAPDAVGAPEELETAL